VFQAMLENAVRICAVAAPDPAGIEAVRRRLPIPLTREYMRSAAILDRPDRGYSRCRDAASGIGRRRPQLPRGRLPVSHDHAVMRGDLAIGTLSVARRAPGPLSDKQRAVLLNYEPVNLSRLIDEVIGTARQLAEKNRGVTRPPGSARGMP
jgi:hypothetical protein